MRTFFDINLKMVKISGMWIPDQGEGLLLKYWYYMYNVIVVGYSVIFDLPMEAWAFKYSHRKIDRLIKEVGIVVTHFLTLIKICVWLKRRKEILGMMDLLEARFSDYEPIGDFKPETIVKEEKDSLDRLSKWFFTLACGVFATQFLTSTWILLADYEKYEETIIFSDNTTSYRYNQKLPSNMIMPWVYNTSKTSYFIALVMNCLPRLYYALIILGFDTVFVALLACLTAHLRILQGAVRTIRPRCLRALKMESVPILHDPKELSISMMNEMNRCILHLQLIFRLCKNMEDIYSYLTLGQVLCSQVIICTALYMVSAVPITNKSSINELDFLVAIGMQIALYCFFGNKVTITADDLSLSLYEGDWFTADRSFKKSMLITMARLRRPVYLTIGKFSPLTLTTFVSIGRASYSFFAVIKNKNS